MCGCVCVWGCTDAGGRVEVEPKGRSVALDDPLLQCLLTYLPRTADAMERWRVCCSLPHSLTDDVAASHQGCDVHYSKCGWVSHQQTAAKDQRHCNVQFVNGICECHAVATVCVHTAAPHNLQLILSYTVRE